MPSFDHDKLVMLFRNRPEMAAELLRDPLDINLPAYDEATTESADLTALVPAEFHADLVVLLRNKRNDLPAFGIVVEVQLNRDQAKHYSWPSYITALRARFRCPVALLVVTSKGTIARWCRTPIDMGHPQFVLRPIVLATQAVPIVLDPIKAQQAPELAVLSAIAHCTEDNAQTVDIAAAALESAFNLPTDLMLLYCDLILAALSTSQREALTRTMQSRGYAYQSDFARKYYGEGHQEGRQEGRQEGERALLTRLLRRKFGALPEDTVARLNAATIEQLDSWADHVLTAATLDQVFNGQS